MTVNSSITIAQTVNQVLQRLGHGTDNLLPILNAIQDELDYIPKESVALIAKAVNLSRAEVHGVVSFYHSYRQQPPGRQVVQVCCAEACQASGVRQLVDQLKASLNVDFHQNTADGEVTLEPVYCLGNCALGPSVLVGKKIVGRATVEKIRQQVHAQSQKQ